MKKVTEKQIVEALKEHESGVPATSISDRLGVSLKAFYYWKAHYSGLNENKMKRFKELVAENKRMKKRNAELIQMLDALTNLIDKNGLLPADKKDCVRFLTEVHQLSIQQACELLNISRSVFYYEGKKKKAKTPVIPGNIY